MLFALVLILAFVPGCYEVVVYDSWDEVRGLGWAGGPTSPRDRARDQSRNPDDDWAIVIKRFEGNDAKVRAAGLVSALRRVSHAPDVWVWPGGKDRHAVLRGRYADALSYQAQGDLQQMRMTYFEGGQPFAKTDLVRLKRVFAPRTDSLDIHQFSGRWPYTLQIAAFDQSDRRRAAQRHAAQLRKQGHEAFYYHGPIRSMVTVGLFTDDDRRVHTTTLPSGQPVKQWVYGPRIRKLQEQFPYNHLNDQIAMTQLPDGQSMRQPSSLVAIP